MIMDLGLAAAMREGRNFSTQREILRSTDRVALPSAQLDAQVSAFLGDHNLILASQPPERQVQ